MTFIKGPWAMNKKDYMAWCRYMERHGCKFPTRLPKGTPET